MPDPNTEHGLRVQLATALRERDEARKACAEMKRERDDYKEAHRHAHETITVVFENRVKKAEEALSAEKARADAGHEAMLSEARLHATHYARADAAEAALAAARRECEGAYRALKMVDDAYWGEFCGCCGVILSLESQDEECGPQHTAVQLAHEYVEARTAGEEGTCSWVGYTDNEVMGRCVLTTGHACPHQPEPTTGEEES